MHITVMWDKKLRLRDIKWCPKDHMISIYMLLITTIIYMYAFANFENQTGIKIPT